jgi:hypothetical protein
MAGYEAPAFSMRATARRFAAIALMLPVIGGIGDRIPFVELCEL